MKPDKHSPVEIVELLKSIKKIEVNEYEIDIFIDGDKYPSDKNSYIYDSFTYRLFELIEDHLLDEED